jgi:hypothetical protein
MSAHNRNYVDLLAPGGDARGYFLNATGGATWVNKVCDEIVEQLQAKAHYTVLDDDVTAALDYITQHALTRRVSLAQTLDGRWQISVDFCDNGGWTVAFGLSPADAIASLYAQERRAREKYGLKRFPAYISGDV